MAGPDRQKLIDDHFTDARMFAGRLSDAAKYVWLGTFGLLYTAMMADKGSLHLFYETYKAALFGSALLGAIAFMTDLTKNFIGFQLALDARRFLNTREAINATDQTLNIDAYNGFLRTSHAPSLSFILLIVSVTAAMLAAGAVAVIFFVAVIR
ncbi:MAG: hypothetical protein PHZ23_00970 [Acidiphilium sp.]|nr:hypothetical protein [Acidiphilium sp.]